MNLSAWIGLLAPAKTPKPVIDQLNRAVVAAMDPELKAKIQLVQSNPSLLGNFLVQDAKFREFMKAQAARGD